MAQKPFDKMNKTELEGTVAFLKLEDVVASAAKDPSKITNAEYVGVLEAFKAKQDVDNADVLSDIKANTLAQPAVKVNNKAEKNIAKTEDLHTMIPVIVTDHDTSISIDEDVEGRTVPVRWGNPVIGGYTTNVPIHGRMQYLPKGAVIRLKKVSLAQNVKNADGQEIVNRNRKRFSVAHTNGWTDTDFEAHRQEQLLKRI